MAITKCERAQKALEVARDDCRPGCIAPWKENCGSDLGPNGLGPQ